MRTIRRTTTIAAGALALLAAVPAVAGAATFSNGAAIVVSSNFNAPASVYPSPIEVKGLRGPIVKAKVSLLGLTNEAEYIDAMVVSPSGRAVNVMDGRCTGNALNGESFTFDDDAAATLPPGDCNGQSGSFKPSGPDPGNPAFPGAAASFVQGSALSAFRNDTANGTWSLFVRSDLQGGPGGRIGGGWSLDLELAPNLECAGQSVTIAGTAGNDTLLGTAQADVFVGLAGRDVIRGLGGNDVICGGGGKDRLIGGAGRDRLIGQGEKDTCLGGGGKDTAARTCEKQKSA